MYAEAVKRYPSDPGILLSIKQILEMPSLKRSSFIVTADMLAGRMALVFTAEIRHNAAASGRLVCTAAVQHGFAVYKTLFPEVFPVQKYVLE